MDFYFKNPSGADWLEYEREITWTRNAVELMIDERRQILIEKRSLQFGFGEKVM